MSQLTRNGVDLSRILRCPTCLRGSVSCTPSAVTCVACGATFDVRHGVPVMLDPVFSRELLDALAGSRAWEDYDSQRINPTVAKHSARRPSLWQRLRPSVRVQVGPTFRQFLGKYDIRGLVLEIGGGPKSLDVPGAVNMDVNAYQGVDVIGDARRMPFLDSVFQGLISNSVLEHIWEVQLVADECHRVTARDGFLFMCVPQVCGRHHTVDYWRWTIPGLVRLFNRFTVVDSGPILGPAMFVHQAAGNAVAAAIAFRPLAKLAVLVLEWLLMPVRFLDRLGSGRAEQVNYAHTIYIVGQKGVE